ncbi:MAG TPA: hypothetical protein VN750_08390 [Steroidobacteraceae bacterium]|nr:hypothetical protein [Steroidobacteraceae bacterium]
MEVQPGTFALESQDNASPAQKPPRTWAGHGTGTLCSACGIAIEEKDIEYEVEMQRGSLRTLHFHFNCYQDWLATQRDHT